MHALVEFFDHDGFIFNMFYFSGKPIYMYVLNSVDALFVMMVSLRRVYVTKLGAMPKLQSCKN